MIMSSIQDVRAHAITHSLFPPTKLKGAIEKLGFVQADPIRAPAAAQDLILRHRVKDYRAGDLERRYSSLDIEEDVLYAYGFLPRPVWQLLHPRDTKDLTRLEKNILDTLRRFGEMHPRDLEEHFGRDRTINAWGGHSKVTTRALEDLHYRGLLRIARREKGIRVYQPAPPFSQVISPMERSRKLVMVVANILAPVPQQSFVETLSRIRHSAPSLGNARTILDELHHAGELLSATIDGITYVLTPPKRTHTEVPRCVRFLAPFDPLVWDRRRFEHLWGWRYRFEAYTPQAKRERGYYAMPLLWADTIIGWANVFISEARLNVDLGFIEKRPRDPSFRSELAAEILRLQTFLKLEDADHSDVAAIVAKALKQSVVSQ